MLQPAGDTASPLRLVQLRVAGLGMGRFRWARLSKNQALLSDCGLRNPRVEGGLENCMARLGMGRLSGNLPVGANMHALACMVEGGGIEPP